MPPQFILSLDFELHWGVFDHTPLDEKGRKYFLTTRALIPEILKLFRQENICCTWATVGMLFAENREQIRQFFPNKKPLYKNPKLNAYGLFEKNEVGKNETEDPFHFAPSLIRQILDTPGQELGSHTFSHYYCLEPEADQETFREDLAATQAIANENFDLYLKSLVLPRNQFSDDLTETIRQAGFSAVRTNPDIWFWKSAATGDEGLTKKFCRLADHYVPLQKTTAFAQNGATKAHLLEVPASRFFRPYIRKFDKCGGQILKISRIKNEMTAAAAGGKNYHLWWHPHNLATHPEKNMAALRQLIRHFQILRDKYGMKSRGMIAPPGASPKYPGEGGS